MGTALPFDGRGDTGGRSPVDQFVCASAGWEPEEGMVVSGVSVSPSAVATLARCLQRAGYIDLADDVGLALDSDWNELQLAPTEEEEMLAVLDDCPALLEPLRDSLRANRERRSRGLQ